MVPLECKIIQSNTKKVIMLILLLMELFKLVCLIIFIMEELGEFLMLIQDLSVFYLKNKLEIDMSKNEFMSELNISEKVLVDKDFQIELKKMKELKKKPKNKEKLSPLKDYQNYQRLVKMLGSIQMILEYLIKQLIWKFINLKLYI